MWHSMSFKQLRKSLKQYLVYYVNIAYGNSLFLFLLFQNVVKGLCNYELSKQMCQSFQKYVNCHN